MKTKAFNEPTALFSPFSTSYWDLELIYPHLPNESKFYLYYRNEGKKPRNLPSLLSSSIFQGPGGNYFPSSLYQATVLNRCWIGNSQDGRQLPKRIGSCGIFDFQKSGERKTLSEHSLNEHSWKQLTRVIKGSAIDQIRSCVLRVRISSFAVHHNFR